MPPSAPGKPSLLSDPFASWQSPLTRGCSAEAGVDAIKDKGHEKKDGASAEANKQAATH